jgi:preprotein translocase subunit Sss1
MVERGYLNLPPENEFWMISVAVWISVGLLFIGSLVFIIQQTFALFDFGTIV